MNIHEKLAAIQAELKAPKGQFNSFGKYKYRNLEDICEAVKPLLARHGCTLTISDKPVLVGDRVYIEAKATLTDIEDPQFPIENTAYAREAESKKGMDTSQVTGATSSYARKYCLNGLFCIDDTKDADTMDNREKPTSKLPTTKQMTKEQSDRLISFCADNGLDHIKTAKAYGITKMMKPNQFENCFKQIQSHLKSGDIGFDLMLDGDAA